MPRSKTSIITQPIEDDQYNYNSGRDRVSTHGLKPVVEKDVALESMYGADDSELPIRPDINDM